MMFTDDERGVQPVIGAILTFALIVLLLGTLQTYAVPNQTEQVEFKHSQDVQADMTDLEAAISQTASFGSELTTQVTVGTQFPARFILLNPPPATGSLRTEAAGDVTLSHVVAAHSDETADFLDGSEKQYTTRRVVYAPSYNRYSSAPETVIEPGVVYDQYDDGALAEKESLVDGKRINLVIVDGNLSESGLNTKVRTDPLSAPTETVAVTNATGEHVEITLATRLDASTWEEILKEDIDGGHVESVVDAGPDRVTVVMEQGPTYKLRMAKVGVSSDATDTSPAYLTDRVGDGAGIAENGRQELTVQVRDEYNNPVVGQNVQFEIAGFASASKDGRLLEGAADDVATVRTDERGLATVTYEAPAEIDTSTQPVTVRSTYDPSGGFNPDAPEDVELAMRVVNGSQEDKGSTLFNPPAGDGVIHVSAVETSFKCGAGPDKENCETEVTFENTAGSTVAIDTARFLFYGSDSQGSASTDLHDEVRIQDIGTGGGAAVLERNEPRTSVDLSFTAGETKTLKFRFYAANGDPSKVQSPDWFVVSFFVDGERSTYFIEILP